MIVACDGIWDCFTNEQAVKYVRNKREKGPRKGVLAGSPMKMKSNKSLLDSPNKLAKQKSETTSSSSKKVKEKGETSFIIEDMMSQGIAKGDITMGDGTGTDNMTCIIVQFRDPNAKDGDTIAEESK